jgi:hypothetical protein
MIGQYLKSTQWLGGFGNSILYAVGTDRDAIEHAEYAKTYTHTKFQK